MKATTSLLFLLLVFSILSCKKETPIAPDLPTEPQAAPTKKSTGVLQKYDTDLSLTPLHQNLNSLSGLPDGTWSGNFGGLRLRFQDFMYEVFYDVNGNALPPKAKDPAYPLTIGPEPGMTTGAQFACLNIITYPNSPDNQLTAQNSCSFQGLLYAPGAGHSAYYAAVDANWAKYQTALAEYNKKLEEGQQTTRPGVPSSPAILPYLLQDYINVGTSSINSARFGVYSYSPSTGIIWGYDLR